jgi:signal transduction histidine kinase
VLAIVIIPSLALLVIGAGAAAYLVHQGNTAQNWADQVRRDVPLGVQFTTRVDEERRLSMLRLAGDGPDSANLDNERKLVDQTLAQLRVTAPPLIDLNSDTVHQLSEIRSSVDSTELSTGQAYDYYNSLTALVESGLRTLARAAPDAASAAEVSTAIDLYGVAEAMSQGNALAASTVVATGLDDNDLAEYSQQVGHYHMELMALLPRLTADEQAYAATLTSSSAWQQLSTMETALIQRGANAGKPVIGQLPLTMSAWQTDAGQVSAALINLWSQHHEYALGLAAAAGHQTYLNSLYAGAAILVLVIISLLIGARVAGRLIRKLRDLRGQTLELATDRLPGIVDRLRAGEKVDIDAELPALDFGQDEVGQVARAFNRAQRTAIAAAVGEANAREGIHAVFLNIAHRSQVVVHRQLAVLDKAERNQEDANQLALLFQLDHLATRARRNAENLIILGGEQPGRKWRNPVSLLEIVRGAVAETEQYARVRTGPLPQVHLIGAVVADLVHLLAELVDNATTFSPPDSHVVVRGKGAAEGIVLEVEDHGLGIGEPERDRLNELLREPPDFGVRALSDDSRLGLFVVGRLAARHDITVTLTESADGAKAVVLLRSTLIASTVDERPADRADEPSPAERTAELPRRRRRLPPPETATPAAAPAPGPAFTPVSWPAEEPAAQPEQSAPTPAVEAEPVAPAAPQAATAAAEPVPPEAKTIEQPRIRDAEPAPDADHTTNSGGLPPLPRRRKQASLSPQLATDRPESPETAGPDDDLAEPVTHRSAEQARNTMTAFQRGTRRARDEPDP